MHAQRGHVDAVAIERAVVAGRAAGDRAAVDLDEIRVGGLARCSVRGGGVVVVRAAARVKLGEVVLWPPPRRRASRPVLVGRCVGAARALLVLHRLAQRRALLLAQRGVARVLVVGADVERAVVRLHKRCELGGRRTVVVGGGGGGSGAAVEVVVGRRRGRRGRWLALRLSKSASMCDTRGRWPPLVEHERRAGRVDDVRAKQRGEQRHSPKNSNALSDSSARSLRACARVRAS